MHEHLSDPPLHSLTRPGQELAFNQIKDTKFSKRLKAIPLTFLLDTGLSSIVHCFGAREGLLDE